MISKPYPTRKLKANTYLVTSRNAEAFKHGKRERKGRHLGDSRLRFEGDVVQQEHDDRSKEVGWSENFNQSREQPKVQHTIGISSAPESREKKGCEAHLVFR